MTDLLQCEVCAEPLEPSKAHNRIAKRYCGKRCKTLAAVRRMRARRRPLEYDDLESVTTWAQDLVEGSNLYETEEL